LIGGLLFNFGPVLSATPTPVKVSELTPVTTVTPDSLLYIVQDPASTPVSRQASVEAVVHAGIEPISISGSDVVISGSLQVTSTASFSSDVAISGTLSASTWALPDHIHDGSANSGGAFDAANLASGTAITNTVLTADGAGLTSWLTPTTQVHDHSDDANGGTFDAAGLTSGAATDGQVLTADGSGGAAWEVNDAAGYTQGCRVYNDANIVTSNGVAYTLTFNSELYDTDTMHSTVSATDRITITTSGVYLIWGNVAFAYNANGVRALYIYVNGTTIAARVQVDRVGNSSGSTIMQATTIYSLSAGDYLQLVAEQNSGGNLNILQVDRYSPDFAAQRIG
jgi:hypothetical protein